MFKRKEEMTQEDKDYNKRHNPEIQKSRWKFIMSSTLKLSRYDIEFMQSMHNNLAIGRTLTEKQAEYLEQLYNRS